MLRVLVRATLTEYHRLGDLKNKLLFLIVLEAWKSKIKVPADPISDEDLLSGLQMFVFLYPHITESRVGNQALMSPLGRALIPFMRADAHDLVTSQRSHLLRPSH